MATNPQATTIGLRTLTLTTTNLNSAAVHSNLPAINAKANDNTIKGGGGGGGNTDDAVGILDRPKTSRREDDDPQGPESGKQIPSEYDFEARLSLHMHDIRHFRFVQRFRDIMFTAMC
ncbi:hypothetical protein OPT61_g2026 [Boeremia exigua]|uniref:Uncharacterized protein n=1 Tax=Boeremia exigua TaxID=749465 RepID=A0ACC2IN78_9PLEO|nr:hypothetical protein OPT61_g2026 [Boeremia exigua]